MAAFSRSRATDPWRPDMIMVSFQPFVHRLFSFFDRKIDKQAEFIVDIKAA